MAARTNVPTTGSVFGKLADRFKQANEEVKNEDTQFDTNADLPAGIKTGVAKLVDIKIDKYKEGDNKGEPYFYAAGVVDSPATHTDEQGNVIGIQGLRTSIMEALCDTPNKAKRKTFKDHLSWVYNELRKLGIDTTQIESEEDLKNTFNAMLPDPNDPGSGIYFKFRTWVGKPTPAYPDPRVQHSWMGVDPNYVSAPSDDVVDEGEPEPAPAPKAKTPTKTVAAPPTKPAAKSAPAASTNGKNKTPVAKKAPEPEPEPEEEIVYSDQEDIDSLVERAGDEEEVSKQLTEMAIAAGYDEDEVLAAESWTDVGEMIKNPKTTDEEETTEEVEDEPEVEDATPEVGQVWKYAKPDPKDKTGKKRMKPTQVEVIKLSTKLHKANLKDLDTGKVIVDVPWSDLQADE